MKYILRPSSLILLLIVVFALSCKKDPCEKLECNNGNCIEGVCLCNEGYEGSNCNLAVRDKFVGVYLADYQGCISTSPDHRVNIVADGVGAQSLKVINLADYACPGGTLTLAATVSGDSLLIAQQTIACGVISYTISGTGTITGQVLQLTFTATYPAEPQPHTDVCTVKLDKQF